MAVHVSAWALCNVYVLKSEDCEYANKGKRKRFFKWKVEWEHHFASCDKSAEQHETWGTVNEAYSAAHILRNTTRIYPGCKLRSWAHTGTDWLKTRQQTDEQEWGKISKNKEITCTPTLVRHTDYHAQGTGDAARQSPCFCFQSQKDEEEKKKRFAGAVSSDPSQCFANQRLTSTTTRRRWTHTLSLRFFTLAK